MREKRRCERWKRRLVRVLLASLLLVLTVVLLVNLALWSGALPWMVRDATRELRYDFAWAWWPSTVHVEGLQIRVAGESGPLSVDASRAIVGLDVWRLALGRLRFDLRAQVDEVRAGGYRLEGPMTVTGSYSTGGEAIANEARTHVRFEGARAYVDAQPVATHIEGTVEVLPPPLAPSQQGLTLDAALEATVIDLTPLPVSAPWSVARGAGVVTVDVDIDDGVIARGSHLSYASHDVVIQRGNAALTTSLRLRVGHDEAQIPGPRAVFAMRNGRLHSEGAVAARFGELELATYASSPRLQQQVLAGARIETDDLIVLDLERFGDLLPSKDITLAGGSARISMLALVSPRRSTQIRSSILLAGAKVDMPAFEVTATGPVELAGSYAPSRGALNLTRLIVDLEDMLVTTERGSSPPTWLRANLHPLLWDGGGTFETSVQGTLGSAAPLFVHVPELAKVVPKAAALQSEAPLRFAASIERSTSDGLQVDVLDVVREGMRGQGRLRRLGEDYRAAFWLTRPLPIGVRSGSGIARKTRFGAGETWWTEALRWVDELTEASAESAAARAASAIHSSAGAR